MGYNCILIYYCNYNKFSGTYILLLLADYNFWYYVCNIHGYAVCTYGDILCHNNNSRKNLIHAEKKLPAL